MAAQALRVVWIGLSSTANCLVPEHVPGPQTPRFITLRERLFDSVTARPYLIAPIAGDDAWIYDRLTQYVGGLSPDSLAQCLHGFGLSVRPRSNFYIMISTSG